MYHNVTTNSRRTTITTDCMTGRRKPLYAFSSARHTLPILVLLLGLAVFAQPGHATPIFVDPGTVGQQSNFPVYSTGPGDITAPDIVFDGMKHVEATRWGFQVTNAGVDDQTDNFIHFISFLSDEHGVEIPGTKLEDMIFNAGPIAPGGVLASAFLFSIVEPIVAHDFHMEIISWALTGNDFDVQTDVIVDGIVGAWVPEPSSQALLGIGSVALLGFAWLCRRKTRPANQKTGWVALSKS